MVITLFFSTLLMVSDRITGCRPYGWREHGVALGGERKRCHFGGKKAMSPLKTTTMELNATVHDTLVTILSGKRGLMNYT
jgi:hypothetical protein